MSTTLSGLVSDVPVHSSTGLSVSTALPCSREQPWLLVTMRSLLLCELCESFVWFAARRKHRRFVLFILSVLSLEADLLVAIRRLQPNSPLRLPSPLPSLLHSMRSVCGFSHFGWPSAHASDTGLKEDLLRGIYAYSELERIGVTQGADCNPQ